MRHPYLDDIVYPRLPDRTLNFGYDVLGRVRYSSVRTLGAHVVSKFPDVPDSVELAEIWLAKSLSTLTGLFHAFSRYWRGQLPPGRYIGWNPRDLTWKNYFVEILDVQCGPAEDFVVEELGDYRPFLMREQLTVKFRTVRETFHPAGSLVGSGR